MSGAVLEPMTFDELSELYRVEMKSSAVSMARKDLFRAMANLLTSLRQEYDRCVSEDPESIMCEGAEARRKSAERLVKDVIRIRTQKICGMALRSATGSRNTLDGLTEEEKDYYEEVLSLSKKHIGEIDRLRGRRKTVETRIDEPIPKKVAEPEPEPEYVPGKEPEVPHREEAEESFDDQPISDGFDDLIDEPFDDPAHQEMPEDDIPAEQPAEGVRTDAPEKDAELESILVRIKEDLPEFAGPERDYKLSKEDIVTLPRVLAEALVNSDKAVQIRPTP